MKYISGLKWIVCLLSVVLSISFFGVQGALHLLPSANAIAIHSVATANTTVTARFQYQARDGSWHPIRFAFVELKEDVPVFGDPILGSGTTGSDGSISIGINLSQAKNVYLKIYCSSSLVNCAYLNLLTREKIPHNWRKPDSGNFSVMPNITYSMGTFSFDNTIDQWKAYDVIIDGHEWVRTKGDGWSVPQVTIVIPQKCDSQDWPCALVQDGAGDTMYIPAESDLLNATSGLIGYRDAILHEYGHLVMRQIYSSYAAMPAACPNGGSHKNRFGIQ